MSLPSLPRIRRSESSMILSALLRMSTSLMLFIRMLGDMRDLVQRYG